MSIRSPLVPLAVILLSLGQLVWSGRNATSTISENLPNPRFSSGLRLVDLVHQTQNLGKAYDLIFERSAAETVSLRGDARLKIQLSSNGRTRILILRHGAPPPSRRSALIDLLRGRARLRIVADRGWIDLGPLPPEGAPLHEQIVGILPGPFGFAELNRPAEPVFSEIRIVRRDDLPVQVLATSPRYRLVVPAPVHAAETLARFFFFLSISRVLQAAGLLSLGLLFVGWWLLGRDREVGGVCCLVSSVVLLHAVCLPPLQGADETGHGATIEALLFRGMPIRGSDPYPRSWSLASEWLEQDRVQYQPEEPLPLGSPEERRKLAAKLERALDSEAREGGPEAPAAVVQGVDARSPLFFRPFALPGAFLRPLTLLDRISAYRILSALSGLLFFCLGAWLLHRAELTSNVVLPYGLVWLIPYMVFAAASVSNYAPAIGLGSLLAASVVSLALSDRRTVRTVAAGILVAGSWLGILLWPDFVFLAPVATLGVALGGLRRAIRNRRPTTRRVVFGTALAAAAGSLAAFAALLLRMRTGSIAMPLPHDLPKTFDAEVFWMGVTVAAPLVLAALAALAVRMIGKLPPEGARRILTGASIALAVLVGAGFLLTPWTSIPYETTRLPFSRLVARHLEAFLSNSLAWDQDTLSWKFWVGAGGWHDVFLPDGLYALGRWLFITGLVLFPSLAVPAVRARPTRVAGLLVVAGFGASLCVLTLTIRYLVPGNPWARFILPWFPLALTPLLLAAGWGRKSGAAAIFFLGVLFQLWIAIDLVGNRYLFSHV